MTIACILAFAASQVRCETTIRWAWLPAVGVILAGCFLAAKLRPKIKAGSEHLPEASYLPVEDIITITALLLYLVSGATAHVSFYLARWIASPGDVTWHKIGIIRLAVGSLVCAPLFLRRGRWLTVLMLVILIVVEIQCMKSLIGVTSGEAVYRDDHPSFMYRFWSFSRAFPSLAYYDPLWNAGKRVVYQLSSGSLVPTVLLLPLWRFTDVFSIYTLALILLFLVVIPLLAAWSARIAGGGWLASFAAATMAIGTSQYTFLWLMHFGTIGASFVLPFAMPVSALLYRILILEEHSVKNFIVLAISSAVLLSWPPAVILCLPILLGVILSWRAISLRLLMSLVLCAIIVAILLLPVFLAILRNTDPIAFVKQDFNEPSFSEGLLDGLIDIRDLFIRGHPIVVFCGIAGVWGMSQRRRARFWGVVITGLLILAGWGKMWKSQLQLERAGIPLFYVGVISASLWVEKFINKSRPEFAPVRAAVTLLILLGGLSYAKLYGNQGVAKFSTMNAETKELVEWIKDNTPPDGRVAFAGSTIHAYGHGHVAMLPVLTGREMMAADYYHFSPKLVEYNYPPRIFRETEDGLFRFAELYNVTYIIAREQKWKKVLRNIPEHFEEVYSPGEKGNKVIFRVKRESLPLYSGKGSVKGWPGKIELEVENSSEPVVLRYHWSESLEANSPAKLEPFDVGYGIKFIKVIPGGLSKITIRDSRWI